MSVVKNLVCGLALVLTTSTPAMAQQAQAAPEASVANYADAHAELFSKHRPYLRCVADAHKESLKAHFTKKMPISGAFYDVSYQGRVCKGFDEFWPVIYRAGFKSPEAFFQLELETAKAAAMKKANLDPALLDARMQRLLFLRDAVVQNPDMPAGDKAKAYDALTAMIMTMDGLRPVLGTTEKIAPVVEGHLDFYADRFPPEYMQLAAEAFEFAKTEETSTQEVMGAVREIK